MSVCEPHAACRWPQPETPSVPRPPGPQDGMRTIEPDRMVARRPFFQCGGTASKSSLNLLPALLTRRAESVAHSIIGRTLHRRLADRPAQPCHGGTRAARRPRRPCHLSHLRAQSAFTPARCPGNNGAWPWTSGARRGLEPADFRHGRRARQNLHLRLSGVNVSFKW